MTGDYCDCVSRVVAEISMWKSTTVPFRVQLRKLSDGKPHEMAAKHSLEIGMSVSNPESCAFSIQLQGPYVGVLVQQDGSADDYDTLAVWNWRTGVLVFVSGSPDPSYA
jgi:hypothetical protein